MGLLYRQENKRDITHHLLEFKDERWSYEDRSLFAETMNELIEQGIRFKVDYGFELFYIIIDSSKNAYTSFDDMIKAFKQLSKLKYEGVRKLEVKI